MKMDKKEYTTPIIKVCDMIVECAVLAGSGGAGLVTSPTGELGGSTSAPSKGDGVFDWKYIKNKKAHIFYMWAFLFLYVIQFIYN